MKKRVLSLIIAICLALSILPISIMADSGDEIIILYTNDVHTYIDGETSYDNLSALRKELLANGKHVLLVDAGDHLQGTAYGAMDNGETIVELMNATGYDLAIPGNHEFDYTISGLENAVAKANYEYISCNFKDVINNKDVFKGYKIFSRGGKKIAFVGVTTPSTLTSTAPAYFQTSTGEEAYTFAGLNNAAELYSAVQTAVDSARNEGADYVIALGHLGVDMSESPWTSKEVIAATSGIDAFIDGHSHTEISGEKIKNKNGQDVLLTQTGSYFKKIGKMTLSPSGITTELIDNYSKSDISVADAVQNWIGNVDTTLGEKIADSNIDFTRYDKDGNRLVRITSTNLADFNADAYYYLINEAQGLNCDIAVINGGGVRDDIAAGDWSYKTLKNVNPFGNVICIIEITGKQLLDALEWGAQFTTGKAGSQETGGFLHAAGVYYEVDTNIKSTVQFDGNGWTGSPIGEYRVKNVKVYNKKTGIYDALDLKKNYTIAGANFTLRNFGDGFNMFKGAKLIKDYISEDYMALADYAKAFKDTDNDSFAEILTENSPLSAYKGYKINYENPLGSGRITIKAFPAVTPQAPSTETEIPPTGDTSVPAIAINISLLSLAVLIVASREKEN